MDALGAATLAEFSRDRRRSDAGAPNDATTLASLEQKVSILLLHAGLMDTLDLPMANKMSRDVCFALVQALVKTTVLRRLRLVGMEATQLGSVLDALARNTEVKLESLVISGTDLSKITHKLIAPLKQATGLRQLALVDTQLGPEGVEALAPAMMNKASMLELLLSNNDMGIPGVTALLPALMAMPHLERLELGRWRKNQLLDVPDLPNLAPEVRKLDNLGILKHLQGLEKDRETAQAERISVIQARTDAVMSLANSTPLIDIDHPDPGSASTSPGTMGRLTVELGRQLESPLTSPPMSPVRGRSISPNRSGGSGRLDPAKHTLFFSLIDKLTKSEVTEVEITRAHVPVIGPDASQHLTTALVVNSSLKKLRFVLPADSFHFESVLQALASNPRMPLESLAIEGPRISPDGAGVLATALGHFKGLTVLRLVDNGLGSEGTRQLARNFDGCPNLVEFSLLSNDPGPEGGHALLPVLRRMHNLAKLELGNWGDRQLAKWFRDKLPAECASMSNLKIIQHLQASEDDGDGLMESMALVS